MSFLLSSFNIFADNKPQTLINFENNASLKIKALATNLKNELSASMQKDGPIAAIETCKLKAPRITQQLNNLDNIKIRRTSLRLRNPNNSADVWELKTLKLFEKKHAAGIPIQKLVYSEEISNGKQTTLRMMRAIPTNAICLTCHGDKRTMSKQLITKLDQSYPDDLATGFSIGDIRGAFSVSQTISN